MEKWDYHESFVLPTHRESLDIAEKIISDLKDKYNINNAKYYNILIAVTEAINNAINHGNQLDKNKQIHFEIFSNEEVIKIIIIDEGRGFNPNALEDCTKKENLLKESGRGIYIMKSLSDEFSLTPTTNGTKFQMTFKIN